MDLPTTHYDNSQINNEKTVKEVDNTKSSSRLGDKLKKTSLYILLATIFLAPLMFIPSPYFSLDATKVIVLSVGVLLSSIFCILSSIYKKDFTFNRNFLVYSIILLAISIALSTFTSSNFLKSFIGQGFEISTASFIFLMFATFFLVSNFAKNDKDTIFSIYITVFASAIILSLFHVLRLFGGVDFMKFGILSYSTSTFIGKWYDFGIFTGILGLISLFGIKFLTLPKLSRTILYISLVISGLLLLAINYQLLWLAILITTLGLIVYEFFTKTTEDKVGIKKFLSRFSLISVIVLAVSVFGVWNNNTITANISKSLHIDQIEILLPWRQTVDIASETAKESPFFGSGPNRFGYQYLKFKPYQDINPTQFWNTEFPSGFSTLSTFAVNQGLVSSVLWLLFLVLFIREGIKSFKRKFDDPRDKFFVIPSFFIAVFLWIMNAIYMPSHTILFLTFLFTGLFVSSVINKEKVSTLEKINNFYSKTKRFVPYLYILMAVILVLWLGLYTKKIIALTYFQSGIKELNITGNLDNVESKFKKAISYDKSDLYYQALSETNILKINNIIKTIQASGANTTPSKESLEQITTLVKEALDYTKKAQSIDDTNYYNNLEEARVSEVASILKFPNSYDNAKNSYLRAINNNKYNPSIYLSLAKLMASNNDYIGAEQAIGGALQLKQNYTEAVFLLSQIQVSNGQLKDAIVSSKVATQLNPNDQVLFMQLGLLYYNDKDYTSAVTALERAVSIDGQYANARYFLGLSYSKLDRNNDAINQFEELAKTNPDSKEVAFILSNLKAGKSPFTNVEPPIDNKPEKRKTLPVTEKTQPKTKSSVKTGQ